MPTHSASFELTSMKGVDEDLVGLEIVLDDGEIEDLLHELDIIL